MRKAARGPRAVLHYGKRLLILAPAILWLLVTGYPFVFMLQTAMKTPFEFMLDLWGLPGEWRLDNFSSVLAGGFISYFTNSVAVSVFSVAGVVILASLASYAFARIGFRAKNLLFLIVLAGMMIPVHITLIPVYVMTQRMGIYDSLTALFGPYIGFSLPISIIILTEFFAQTPKELEDAARIDGCSHFQTFLRIMMPISKPALATVSIYNFIYVWNEFVFALVLISSPGKMTLPLGLREFYGQFTVNIPGLMAAIFLAALPVILFYLAAQERVVRGLTAGALKG